MLFVFSDKMLKNLPLPSHKTVTKACKQKQQNVITLKAIFCQNNT